MSVWSPTGSGNVRIDVPLTNISLGWPNNGLVGEALFPTVTVQKQSGKYYVFGREAWLPETSDYRAPGTEANEIPGFTVSLDTFYAQEHALQVAITDEEREMVDPAFAPDRDGTMLLTSKILLGRELAMYNLVTTTTNYATGFATTMTNGTLSTGTQWDSYTSTSSNPITDVRTGVRKIHSKIFMEPNTIVIPYVVMSYLEDHPVIIQRIQYAEAAILTPDIIASVFGIQKVIVPGVGYATGPVGSSGNALTVGYLWGDNVLIAYVPDNPGLRTPAFAYEFSWTYGGTAMVVDRWREEKRASDVLRLRRRYDLKFVGVEINPGSGDFGKSITGYFLGNVLFNV
jgi:hypothetical protein